MLLLFVSVGSFSLSLVWIWKFRDRNTESTAKVKDDGLWKWEGAWDRHPRWLGGSSHYASWVGRNFCRQDSAQRTTMRECDAGFHGGLPPADTPTLVRVSSSHLRLHVLGINSAARPRIMEAAADWIVAIEALRIR